MVSKPRYLLPWAIIILMILSLLWLFSTTNKIVPSGEWQTIDVVTILLTVVTIVVAVFGIAIAMAAFVGYRTISTGAKQTAESAITDYLSSPEFKESLEKSISEAVDRKIVLDETAPRISSEPYMEEDEQT